MTWCARLAALGCLVAACTPVGPLPTFILLAACMTLGTVSLGGRVPWCACGHGRAVHTHYRPGSDCSLCTCSSYNAPHIWRKA
jgi:hypothetical protein